MPQDRTKRRANWRRACAKWRAAHPGYFSERSRAWRERHPDDGIKRREALRRRVFGKTDGVCVYCGGAITFDNFQMDHIFPRSRGGEWSFENLDPSCEGCNREKADLSAEEFRAYIKRIIEESEQE